MGSAKIPQVAIPQTPGPAPDPFSDAVRKAQRMAMMRAGRGLASTFRTTPPAPTALGMSFGPLGGSDGTGGA